MRRIQVTALAAFVFLGAVPGGGPVAAAQAGNAEATSPATAPAGFGSPQAAAAALKTALVQSDTDGLVRIFGTDARDLFTSPDPATARTEQQHAAKAITEQLSLVTDAQGGVWLLLGHKQWSFPFELTQHDGEWSFDVTEGRARIAARRIGADEIVAIDTLHALVGAQRAYAARFKSPSGAPLYARYIQSTPGGSTDGLWWDHATAAKAGKPPLGPPKGASQRSAFGSSPSDPFHGYHFRVLTAQGPLAPGGAKSYIQDDLMTGGFAVIAWPADYGTTGVMTFLVGPDGHVLQRDLGEDTDKAVRSMLAYDPGPDWSPAQ